MSNESRKSVAARAPFVNRAAVLLDSHEFLDSLELNVRQWNARYPDYAVSHDGFPPDAPDADDFTVILPPRLPTLRSIEERGDEEVETVQKQNHIIQQARAMWRQAVLALCRQHWRELNETNWMANGLHPAHHFVAACLLWRPKFVPPEWICASPPPIITIPYDVRDAGGMETHPSIIFYYAYLNTFDQAVRDHFAQNGNMILEEYERFDNEAARAATEAVEANGHTAAVSQVIVLTPGMNAEDLRKHAKMLVEAADTEAFHERRARQMYSEEYSKGEIARQLGRSRKWVQDALNSAETRDFSQDNRGDEAKENRRD